MTLALTVNGIMTSECKWFHSRLALLLLIECGVKNSLNNNLDKNKNEVSYNIYENPV